MPRYVPKLRYDGTSLNLEQHGVQWHSIQHDTAEGTVGVSWVEEVLSLVLSYSKTEVQDQEGRATDIKVGASMIPETFDDDDDHENVIYLYGR